MEWGLSTTQGLAVIGPVLGALIMIIVNVVQYDKQENSKIAAQAKSQRWDEVKEKYGRVVSNHLSGIENEANTFIDVTDPDDSAETMSEFLDRPDELLELHRSISAMEAPEVYHSRCRKGAEGSLVLYGVSLAASIVGILFWPVFLYITAILFVIALALTGIFLIYRAKINGLADEVQFRV